MQSSKKQESKQNKQGHVNKPRPDVRDDMDSRKHKEGNYKSHNNSKGKGKVIKDKNKSGN